MPAAACRRPAWCVRYWFLVPALVVVLLNGCVLLAAEAGRVGDHGCTAGGGQCRTNGRRRRHLHGSAKRLTRVEEDGGHGPRQRCGYVPDLARSCRKGRVGGRC